MGIRRAGGCLVAAIVIAAAAPSAFAQDFRGMSLEDRRIELLQAPGDLMGSVSIQGRYSVPLGSLDISDGLSNYVDAFDAGLGLASA